jgi:hypothetical protein
VLETVGDLTSLPSRPGSQPSNPFHTRQSIFERVADGDVLWVDWMLIFRNGAVGMAQVAKEGFKPVYSTKG